VAKINKLKLKSIDIEKWANADSEDLYIEIEKQLPELKELAKYLDLQPYAYFYPDIYFETSRKYHILHLVKNSFTILSIKVSSDTLQLSNEVSAPSHTIYLDNILKEIYITKEVNEWLK
jgi:hypothetical protein